MPDTDKKFMKRDNPMKFNSNQASQIPEKKERNKQQRASLKGKRALKASPKQSDK